MNEQEKARADLTAATERESGPTFQGGARAASAPKFIQRRGVRGFNNQPKPAHFPQPTPTPPAPKWRVPVEGRKE